MDRTKLVSRIGLGHYPKLVSRIGLGHYPTPPHALAAFFSSNAALDSGRGFLSAQADLLAAAAVQPDQRRDR